MAPMISVIMPAYNSERHIADSIRSVLRQTFADWELIVIDDGSTDRTGEIVRGLVAADARVRYVQRKNGGQAAARNTGIRNSWGELIAFLDSDDLWLPKKLERQLAALHDTGASLVYSDVETFSESGDEIADEFGVVHGKFGGEEMFRLLLARNHIPVLSVLVLRTALEQVQLFDPDRRYQNCEDYELWLRLARAGATFYGMRERLVRYRRHSGSTTHHESNVLRPMIAVIRKHAGYAGPGSEEVRSTLRNLYRNLTLALVRENKLPEAREYMREFAAWDSDSLVTRLQQFLLGVKPGWFNFVSRECLFRIEWHANRILGKRHATPSTGASVL